MMRYFRNSLAVTSQFPSITPRLFRNTAGSIALADELKANRREREEPPGCCRCSGSCNRLVSRLIQRAVKPPQAGLRMDLWARPRLLDVDEDARIEQSLRVDGALRGAQGRRENLWSLLAVPRPVRAAAPVLLA